jgi:hypothetical protein
MLDEVGSCGGQQGVGGEIAVGLAGDLLQHALEQTVPPLVMVRLVRATAPPSPLQGQREASVVELEAQEGIEQREQAVPVRARRPQRRGAGLDSLPDRLEPGLVQRAEQSDAIITEVTGRP